jgi:hypothetical protein
VVVPQELLKSGTVTPPPLKMLSCHIALEDSTLAGRIGGAIGVIPRSYLAGRAPAANETDWDGVRAQAVELKAGDVLLLRCDTWRIDTCRKALEQLPCHTLRIDYAERNIAQRFLSGEGALSFQYNPEVVAACNDTQKRLLGKRAHGAYD